MKMTMGDGKMHMESTRVTMAGFAEMLSRFVGKPVVDKTELKGTYDMTFEIRMADMMAIARTAGVAMPGMRRALRRAPDRGVPPTPLPTLRRAARSSRPSSSWD